MKIIQSRTIQMILQGYITFERYVNLSSEAWNFKLSLNKISREMCGNDPSQIEKLISYFKTEEYFNKAKQEFISLIEESEIEPVYIDLKYLCFNLYLFNNYYSEGSHCWFFKGDVYELSQRGENFSRQQEKLLVLEYYDKDRKKWEKLNHLYGDEKPEYTQLADGKYLRQSIPEKVRIDVWRRDDGKCARCGSRERLEYDHIVPVSRGGANTARNIELLCEKCNREKYNNIQ